MPPEDDFAVPRYFREEEARGFLERLNSKTATQLGADWVPSPEGFLWVIDDELSGRWRGLHPPPCVARLSGTIDVSHGSPAKGGGSISIGIAHGRISFYALEAPGSPVPSGAFPYHSQVKAYRDNVYAIDERINSLFPIRTIDGAGRRRL